MSAPPPEIEQSDAMLAEAAQSDLVLMRHAQSLALATDDPQEVASLVHAYARASRCMRQNLALLAKQKADRVKAAREAVQYEAWLKVRNPPPPERDLREMAYEERTQDLETAVGRVISAASGSDRVRHTGFAHRFDRELDDWVEADDFVDEELDEHVLRACRVLGLPEDLAARWRDLPEPTYFPDPETRPASRSDTRSQPDELPEPDTPAEPDARAVPWANSA